MPADPAEIRDLLDQVERAFSGRGAQSRTYEPHLDPTEQESSVIQLRKACRLLDACRLLRGDDGYYTSVIEMSFAAIERTLEFYALTAANDEIGDFREGHERVYDRAAALRILSEETADRLKTIYRNNRAAAYYRDTVAAARQADLLFQLAVAVHDHVKNRAQLAHECRCRR